MKNKTKINHEDILIPSKSPTFQSEFQKEGSKQLAINYFKTVYQIAKNIDMKLDTKKEYYK